jgi:CzcA family heavy metal efflux pump
MLSRIVALSLRYRAVVTALGVLMLIYGIYSATQAKYDVFPEFAAPQISLQTEAIGLSPEQVEALVTQPIENALNGLPGIESLRSESVQGLSIVIVVFTGGRDIYLDRQATAERLTTLAGQLPQGVGQPVMEPLTSATGDLITIGLTSDKLSLMELRTLAEWTVRRRLLAVRGVAKVSIFGGDVRQFQIQVHPAQLRKYDLSIADIVAAAQTATGVRGAGFIDTPERRIVLQVEGQSLTPEQLSRTALVRESASALPLDIMLGDVATIVEAPAPALSAATVMGKPGVVLNVWAQYQANTLEATRYADAALAELKPGLDAKGVIMRADLFRSANFVDTAVSNIRGSLLIGAALVVIVLFMFLLDLRTSLISCSAIPLSLLAAVAALRWSGHSLNTMTLGGLAIAIGEVVDDAVIDVENILRRLRLNRDAKNPLSPARVVLDASLEVRSAVVYATAAVCVVFMPVLALPGLAGRLFGPLALAYIYAILASLAVALTLTPALCLMLLGRGRLPEEDGPLARRLKAGYRLLLESVEGRPRAVLSSAAALVVLGLCLTPFLGGEFLPQFHEGHFIVHMTAPPGTSLAESVRLGGEVTAALTALPLVRTVAQRVGRAAVDDVFGPNASEFEVDLKPGAPADADVALRAAVANVKGADFEFNTFLSERIGETIAGETAPVVVTLAGPDLDALDAAAAKVLALIEKTKGSTDARVQSPGGLPRLDVKLKPAELLRWGLDPVAVLDAVSSAYEGKIAGQIYEGDRVVDLSVVLAPSERRKPSELGELRVRNAAGTYVPLKKLADIKSIAGRSSVLHRGAQRVQIVTSGVSGRDEASVVSELEQGVAALGLPAGITTTFEGASAAQASSSRDLLVNSLLAGSVIVLLLSVVMGHWRNLLLVLLNLPLALSGGVVTIFLFRYNLSIGCLVGFVTLFGITLRNAIMMVSHFEHLVEVEGLTWGAETALRGAVERLIPVLMTALVTGLGLLPLALGAGAPGREIEGPMALVILGGLCTSTALNLLVLPTLALRFGRFEKRVPEL